MDLPAPPVPLLPLPPGGAPPLPPPPRGPGWPGPHAAVPRGARLRNPAVWIPATAVLVVLALVGATLLLTNRGGGVPPANAAAPPVPGVGLGPPIFPAMNRCVDGPWQRYATAIAGLQSYVHNNDFPGHDPTTAHDLGVLAADTRALSSSVTDARLKRLLDRAASDYRRAADMVAGGHMTGGTGLLRAGNAVFALATRRAALLVRC